MCKDNKRKAKYKVINWSEYNLALKGRGSLTIWFSEDFDQKWLANRSEAARRGRPILYSDYSIEAMLSLRSIHKMPLRQLTGFVESIFSLAGFDLAVPEFSRLPKRSSKVLPSLKFSTIEKDTHIVFDSTGLKVYGEKEWLETKHGKQYIRKVWRKVHIGVDGKGKIIAQVMTDHRRDDRIVTSSLLEQINTDSVDELLADSSYDSYAFYRLLENQNIRPIISIPKRAVISSNVNPSVRDKTVDYIKKKGYWAWRVKNNFGRREKVENTFYRLKTIFGRKLLSRRWQNQESEVNLICYILNKFTSLGMPKTVRIA